MEGTVFPLLQWHQSDGLNHTEMWQLKLPQLQQKWDQSVALRVQVFPTGLWYKSEIFSTGIEKPRFVL